MDIFLTGGTGYVGSAVLAAALRAGHTVHALARTDEAAAALRDAGAERVLGSMDDTDVLTDAARAADGVVHLASPGDETSAQRDEGLINAVLDALRGTDKPLLHT